MGMTMTQKILAAHAGLDSVRAGQLVSARADMVLGNDITTPVAVNEFNKAGFTSVFDTRKVTIVLDHFIPNKDIKAAEQAKTCRQFARKYGVEHFYDVGEMGIEHALLPEKGLVAPGELCIGAPTARWAHFPPASVPPTWPQVSQPARPGSRFPRRCALS